MADKPRALSPDIQLRVDAQSRPRRGGALPTGGTPPTTPDIDFLLTQAEEALASADDEPSKAAAVRPYELHDFTGSTSAGDVDGLDRIRDVELDLKIELGRTQMALEDVLKLRSGSVVPLDKLAGEPVDVVVNGRLIARGEVLVLNGNFCVRVLELLGQAHTSSHDDAGA